MTAPTPAPSKFKTYVALAGSLLSFVVPLVVSVEQYLPPQWAAVIGGVIALLTAFGVYHAPYTKPAASVVADVTPQAQSLPPNADGTYQNPWPKP
jgi:protein-S-isoprenylcysteine O-methyltransferase Ste14